MNEPDPRPIRPTHGGNVANQVDSAATGSIDRLRSRWLEYWNSPQPKKDAVFLCTVLAIVFVVNGTVAGHVYVPTGSMKDTIRENERFIVWKLGYGVQNLFSPRHKLRVKNKEVLRWRDVARGDIVMFVPPKETGVDDKFVKRVVALPGEIVEVRPAEGVFINGRLLKETYLRELPGYWVPPQVVPEGKIFVLGDNRNNSYDSHAWGFLDSDSVQGVMVFRYWPLNRMGFLGAAPQQKNRMACLVVGCVVAGYSFWQISKRKRRARSSTT